MPISGSEALVLLIIAVVVVGPERLPAYAEQLARLVRELKAMATGAQERLRTELGDDLPDLTQFDPRRYDPRRIVREALLEDAPLHTAASSRSAAGTLRPPRTGATAAGATAAGATAAAGAAPGPVPPFDDEAT